MKVASPQLTTDLPIVASRKLSPTSKSVVIYAFNKLRSCSWESRAFAFNCLKCGVEMSLTGL